MLKYAIKSLLKSKGKTILSILGIAAAMLLIITLDGIFAGNERQLTHYIDNSKADIIVSQEGVKTMHLGSSFLPATMEQQIKRVEGVSDVAGIIFTTQELSYKNNLVISHLIGFDSVKSFGGPWKITKGKYNIKQGQVLIDEVIAKKYNIKIGNKVEINDRKYKVAGTTSGSFSIIATLTFLNKTDLSEIVSPNLVSYFLVQSKKGKTKDVIRSLKKSLSGTTVLTRKGFSKFERRAARHSGTEVLAIITGISFIAALAVVGLTIYTATLEKIRDYGIFKSIGSENKPLYFTVLIQGMVTVFTGSILGILAAMLISKIISVSSPELLIILTLRSILKVFLSALGVSILASIIPMISITNIQPMLVFKKS